MAEARPSQVPILAKMEIADILDAAIRLYRHNFLLLLEIVAVVQLVVLAGSLVMTWLFFGSLMGTSGEEVPWAAIADNAPLFLVCVAGMIILLSLGQGALAFAISEAYLGRRISVAEAYRRMWPLVWRLLLTMILVGLATATGLIFCIIPAFILMVWFAITTPIVAIERIWGPEAMRRSYDLISGHGWRVFATLLLLYLIVVVATYAIYALPAFGIMMLLGESNPLVAQSLSQAVQTVANIIVQPVVMIGIVLIYYDLRIRKEGFDLMMLAQAMEASSPGAGRDWRPEGFRPASVELPPRPEDQPPLPPKPGQSEEGLPPRGE